MMVLKLVNNKEKLEINKDCKEKIDSLFKVPDILRAKLYETISFTEILSLPFKRTLNDTSIDLPPNQTKLLSRAGYYDLIVDYLTLSALNDLEKKYLFDDLNHERTPFFLKFKAVTKNLKKIKTPLTPFTVQEVEVKYLDVGDEKIRQEIVKKGCVRLTNKGLSMLLRLCPKLKLFNPVFVR